MTRGVAETIDRERLEKRLASGEKLRVKFGVDPTSPNIHLGRAVALLKLRDFQKLGHHVVFIVGDMTGIIGDTSDKDAERPMLTQEQVKDNMRSYLEQAFTILDRDKTETHYNSEWLSGLGFLELGKMASLFGLHEFSAREVIARRLEAGQRVSFHEMLYPLFQGYDSVAVKADIEIGGTDQRFNMLAGRKLQEHYGQDPQSILTLDLIPGTDGRKMSSSWGNTINLIDKPDNMFGKVMSMPDDLIGTYFVSCTRVPLDEIKVIMDPIWSGEGNPRDAKLRLAHEIVALYHGVDAAETAERYFVDTFSKHVVPETVGELSVAQGEILLDVIARADLAESKTDARRKMEQGGVELGGERITDRERTLTTGDHGKILRVGKKEFRRVMIC